MLQQFCQLVILGTLLLFSGCACTSSSRGGDSQSCSVDHPESCPGSEEISWTGPSDVKLSALKEQFNLSSVYAASDPEWQQLLKLRNWVHSRWQHDGMNFPENYDSVFILNEAAKGVRFRCVEYSFVLADVYRAMGWPARLVRVQGSQGAHVLSEVFIASLDKWVLMDGQHDAHVTIDDTPLSVYEFYQATHPRAGEPAPVGMVESQSDGYVEWTQPYLEYLMYPQSLAYGMQLKKMFVLADPDLPELKRKPSYLEQQGTVYIRISDPAVVYSKIGN